MSITTEEAERLAEICDQLGGFAQCAAALRSLAAERDALRQERDGANALVKRMHEQDVLAIKAWQAAHPGFEITWPSCARLSAWCMGEVASVTAERDALKAEIEKLRVALRPFANALQGHYHHQVNEMPIVAGYHKDDLRFKLTLGDFRKARAVLGEKK